VSTSAQVFPAGQGAIHGTGCPATDAAHSSTRSKKSCNEFSTGQRGKDLRRWTRLVRRRNPIWTDLGSMGRTA
jgi:hypothetical protein